MTDENQEQSPIAEPVIDTVAEAEPLPLAEVVRPPQPINRKNSTLDELKHSIQTHIVLMNGMSIQLGQFLLKMVDFIEDPDQARRDAEMAKLAYIIIEAVAVFVHQSIDDRAQKAEQRNVDFPARTRQAGDNLLVVIGKTRSSTDRIGSKNIVLRAIADALRELSNFTKTKYPSITDCSRNEL